MIEQALQELTEECEQGFKVWPVEFCAKQAHVSHDGRVVGFYYEMPREERAQTVLFSKIVGGQVTAGSCETREDYELPWAVTREEAIAQFRSGWADFRNATPGDTLLWRVKPTFHSYDHPQSGDKLFCVRARAAIVQMPERATQ